MVTVPITISSMELISMDRELLKEGGLPARKHKFKGHAYILVENDNICVFLPFVAISVHKRVNF